MNSSKINYPSASNMLFHALIDFFCSYYGNKADFLNWFSEVGSVTDGWKLMDKDKSAVNKINEKYAVPEWFVLAIHNSV